MNDNHIRNVITTSVQTAMSLDLWKEELVKNMTELTNRLNTIEEDNVELKQDNLELKRENIKLKSQVQTLIQEQEVCKNNYTRGINNLYIDISKFLYFYSFTL